MRRSRYFVGYLLRFWPTLILGPVERLIAAHFPQETVEGIKIVDTSLRAEVDKRFLADTADALHLIKSVDPRRYRRVQLQIKRIVNNESWRFASYNRPERQCEVDYGQIVDFFASEHREWHLWWYAATLVHEATHGAIYSRQILYTKKTRVRIEHLCHTEEKRFAKKADNEVRQWSEALIGAFDEHRWDSSWSMTRWRAMQKFFARLREVRQSLSATATDQNKK